MQGGWARNQLPSPCQSVSETLHPSPAQNHFVRVVGACCGVRERRRGRCHSGTRVQTLPSRPATALRRCPACRRACRTACRSRWPGRIEDHARAADGSEICKHTQRTTSQGPRPRTSTEPLANANRSASHRTTSATTPGLSVATVCCKLVCACLTEMASMSPARCTHCGKFWHPSTAMTPAARGYRNQPRARCQQLNGRMDLHSCPGTGGHTSAHRVQHHLARLGPREVEEAVGNDAVKGDGTFYRQRPELLAPRGETEACRHVLVMYMQDNRQVRRRQVDAPAKRVVDGRAKCCGGLHRSRRDVGRK